MVHTRINESVANPNPFINFITPLDDSDDARELLRALAAQIKPVMKSHGFTVNSFEEVSDFETRSELTVIFRSALQYENNKVFLGRNWNNGETIGEFIGI